MPPSGLAEVGRAAAGRSYDAAVPGAGGATLGAFGPTDVLAAARALEGAGRRVLHLEVGEPDVPTPAHVVEAGVRALRDGHTRYSPPAGIPELRAAAAASLAARGVPADPGRVVVGPGAKAVLFAALLAAVRAGDEVLVPDPGYAAYREIAERAGGRAVAYALDAGRGFAVDVDAVRARVTRGTRVLVVNAPHNPTGGVLGRAVREELAELACRHDLLVVSDEIYARHVYTEAAPADVPAAHPSLAGLPGMAERTVVVDGCSKAYAMTGWRLGYGAVPARFVGPVTAVLAQAATCTATFVQHAGVAALAGPQDALVAQVAELRRRRDVLVAALGAIDGVACPAPGGALYAFPRVAEALAGTGWGVEAFARRLLEEYGVACVPGTAFGPGGAGHVRLALTAPVEELTAAAGAFGACLRAIAAGVPASSPVRANC